MQHEVTKFRLSNHRLAIETGRHDDGPKPSVDMNYEMCKYIADATKLRNIFFSKPKTIG